MSRIIYKSFIWQLLTVGFTYLVAFLLKILAYNTIPLAKYAFFQKVPYFLEGLSVNAFKGAYWLAVAFSVEVVVFIVIQLKNRNLGRLVRSVRFERRMDRFYSNEFKLKTRVFFSEDEVTVRISSPRNNEEQQKYKKFSSDMRDMIINEFHEYSFPVDFTTNTKKQILTITGIKN